MNYLEASKVDLKLLSDNKKVNGTIMMSTLILLSLKFLADVNCKNWKVGYSDTFAIIGEITLECIFINFFYGWYKKQVAFLKIA